MQLEFKKRWSNSSNLDMCCGNFFRLLRIFQSESEDSAQQRLGAIQSLGCLVFLHFHLVVKSVFCTNDFQKEMLVRAIGSDGIGIY